MYLNITMKFFSTLFSNISMVDEQKVIAKIFPGVKMLLFSFVILTMIFLMNFLICSVRLIIATVLLCFQTNQNMVRIMVQNMA